MKYCIKLYFTRNQDTTTKNKKSINNNKTKSKNPKRG